MFSFIYQITVSIAVAMLQMVSVFRPRIRLFLHLRKEHQAPKPAPKKYLIHCASLGEFEMAKPIIEHLVQRHGKEAILLTFFSPSGLEHVKRMDNYSQMCAYLPLDRANEIRDFLVRYKPEKIILVRYELWFNLLRIGLKMGIDFYLMNARFSKGHFIFSLLGRPYLNLLKSFKWIFCSDTNTQKLLEKRALKDFSYFGDTRFDRVLEIASSAKENPEIERFIDGKKAIILGSSWWAEEEMMNDIFHEFEGLKLIIAPHDIKEEHLIQIETLFAAYNPKRFSSGDFGKFDQVLVLDSIGLLSSMYRYANIAFIGGGFKGALHNIIEPAVWGSVIFFGPDTEKFPEAEQFIQSGFAFEVSKSPELKDLLQSLLQDEKRMEQLKNNAAEFVQAQAGASEKIIQQLAE